MNKRLFILLIAFCSACTFDALEISTEKDSAPINVPVNVMAVPDAVPRFERRTRAGNPVEYQVLGKRYKVLAESKGYQQRGIASWYGTKFHGKKTSNGEVYDMYAMTAAHTTLPIPSYVSVTNLKNRRRVVVRINDRGPFHENRIIDLSYAAAVKLGIQKMGTGFVEVTALEPGANEIVRKNNYQSSNQQQDTVVYIQIGAFNNQFNARQLQEKLRSRQIANSRVQVSHSQDSELYKVQVGPLDTVHQTDELIEKLTLIGLQNTQLVTEKK